MTVRADHAAIAGRVADGARVLDVGCGDGSLLALLKETRGVDARGLELTSQGVQDCLALGLSVIQGNADEDLEIFPDDGFDVAILSRAIQEMRRPRAILAELARIAPEVIISFRNYGQWKRRVSLMSTGRMRETKTGPGGMRSWGDEHALHPSTAVDMLDLTDTLGLTLKAMAPVSGTRVGAFRSSGLGRLNWGAEDVILHLARGS